jgi:hypothetical protein
MRKVERAVEAIWFEDLPNVGKRVAEDFKKLGLSGPQQLKGKDPFKLYERLCRITRLRQDPCLLDTFIAAVYFMDRGIARPWWSFSADRKKKYPCL